MPTARKKPAPRKAAGAPRKRTEPILKTVKPAPVLTVQLSDGNTAELHDPARMTNGERRPIMIASEDYNKTQLDPLLTRELQKAVAQKDVDRQTELIAALNLDSDEGAELRVADVLITVLVESWTLDLPLPAEEPINDDDGQLIGSHVLDRILAHDYDALRWATARLMPALKHLPSEPQSRPT